MISYLLLLCIITPSLGNECKRWSSSYAYHLATKTPYRIVSHRNSSRLHFEGCTPIKAWMMVRHGTRFPGREEILAGQTKLLILRGEIIKAFEDGRSSLCVDVIDTFRKWDASQLNLDKEKDLAHEGEEEMLEIAERFQQRLPEMFSPVYSSKYEFKTSGKQRAIDSMRWFMNGLFGRNTVDSIWPLQPDPTDLKVVRFYKQCPRWRTEVKKNSSSLLERQSYINSPEFSDLLRNVSVRIGLPYVLDSDTAFTMYTLCGFETSWDKNRKSAWCSIFTDQEFTMLELAQDFKYYHIDGYGHQLNHQQTCPSTQHLLRHFLSEEGPTTSISFSHSGTVLKLLATYGLYNDSDWRTTKAVNRLWRTSRIDAFATNLAFILYRCASSSKFLFLHQERIIPLPGCPDDDLCPLNVLMEKHGKSLDNCSFYDMCKLPKNS